ncbi:MAG TPA: winged helix-turn-helix transcriptional regulator, partial [Microbacterium sp.]|nr:winged helix-turn-helix transcriptional regulator [Microbacterium sp.]
MATRAARGFGQYSGAARALERVGDRWALLIVRDLLVGARRYGDLKAGLPRIPTNILSDRLKELQEAGVIRRVPTVRGGYELTTFGRALEPVVVALERWGWSALGFSNNPMFTDENAACVVLDDYIYFMVLTREYLGTFTDKQIIDPKTHAQTSIAFTRDSR